MISVNMLEDNIHKRLHHICFHPRLKKKRSMRGQMTKKMYVCIYGQTEDFFSSSCRVNIFS